MTVKHEKNRSLLLREQSLLNFYKKLKSKKYHVCPKIIIPFICIEKKNPIKNRQPQLYEKHKIYSTIFI